MMINYFVNIVVIAIFNGFIIRYIWYNLANCHTPWTSLERIEAPYKCSIIILLLYYYYIPLEQKINHLVYGISHVQIGFNFKAYTTQYCFNHKAFNRQVI